jgi:hypothetical protein
MERGFGLRDAAVGVLLYEKESYETDLNCCVPMSLKAIQTSSTPAESTSANSYQQDYGLFLGPTERTS